MKKSNKGFTIVELVIVIAVIAILAAVLIPTFSGVVQKANQSAALQEATSAMKATLAMSDYGTITENTQFVIVGSEKPAYLFAFEKNAIVAKELTGTFDPMAGYNAIVVKGTTAGDVTSFTATELALIHKVLSFVPEETDDIELVKKTGYYVIQKVEGEGATYLCNDETYHSSSAEGYDIIKIFVNTDYPDDIVTITKSN